MTEPVKRHPLTRQALEEGDTVIVGRKGKGKTYAAKGIVERLVGWGHQVVVLDPLRHGQRGESLTTMAGVRERWVAQLKPMRISTISICRLFICGRGA